MTDKVQKIREEVERLMNELIQEKGKGYGSDADDACILELQNILTYIDSLQEEPKSKFDCCILPGDDVRYNEELGCRVNLTQLQRVAKKDPKYCMYSKDSYTDEERKVLCDGCEENCKYNLKQEPDELTHSVTKISNQEEPVSEVWHNASKEPNDMSHCLIYYGCKESVGHYLHYESVLYNKKEKVFVTPSFPHPTGYKVEQKSIDGGCVAEVYKNKRDRISISDITQWCYLKDLHNFSNVQRTVKNWKEQLISENLEEAAEKYAQEAYSHPVDRNVGKADFIAGAKWQKKKMMKEVVEGKLSSTITGSEQIVSAYAGYGELGNDGDKVKLIIIKED